MKNYKIYLGLFLFQIVPIWGQTSNFLYKTNIDYSLEAKKRGEVFGSELTETTVNYEGKFTKSFTAFRIFKNDIINPTFNHTSSNLKVNDWGNTVGINWNLNIAPVIYRNIRGIPDEVAEERLSPSGKLTDSDHVKKIQLYNISLSDNSSFIDGEYDIFNLVLYDRSAEFIISNNSIIFLANKYNFTGKIISIAPLVFEITDTEGNLYTFGSNNNHNKIVTDRDNTCFVDSSPHNYDIVSEFYLSKIVLNTKKTITYEYEKIKNIHRYSNYSEAYTFKDKEYSNVDRGFDPSTTPSLFSNYTKCLSGQYIDELFLKKIVSDDFLIKLEYDDRADIIGSKILKNINIYNLFNELIERTDLEYSLIESTSESLSGTNFTDGLNKRYFLKKIRYTNDKEAYKTTSFDYISPQLLPMRFSLSQDLYGFANSNARSLLPKHLIDKFSFSHASLGVPEGIPSGNRLPNSVTSQYGLLQGITYSTGLYESFIYEQNKIEGKKIQYGSVEDKIYSDDYNFKTGTISVGNIPIKGKLKLLLDFRYTGDNLLEDNSGEEYNFNYYLWDNTINKAVTREKTLVPYFTSKYPEYIEEELDIEKDHDYSIRYTMMGENVNLYYNYEYPLKYVPEDIDYFGTRVKNISQKDNENRVSDKIIRYNSTEKNENIFNLKNSSSILITEIIPDDYISLNWTGQFEPKFKDAMFLAPPPHLLYFYRVSSDSEVNMFHYNNSAICYQNITWLDDITKEFKSFTYDTSRNDYGSRLIDKDDIKNNKYGYIRMDNKGRSSGNLLEQYQGKIDVAGKLEIQEEKTYHYNSKIIENFPNIILTSDYNNTIIPQKGVVFTPQVMFYLLYPLHLTQYFLTQSYDYLSYTATKVYEGKNFMLSETYHDYNFYNNNQKTLKSQKTEMADVSITQNFSYPTDFLNSNLAIFFKNMIDKNMIDKNIKVNKFRNNTLVESTVNMFDSFNNLILNSSVSKSKIELDVFKDNSYFNNFTAISYDAYGHLTEYLDNSGIRNIIVWGYKESLPILFIKNSTISSLPQEIITDLKLKSNNNVTQSIIDNIRKVQKALPEAQVVGVTYKPLVGLTNAINEYGIVTNYIYDQFNNLSIIKDQEGNLLYSIDSNFKNKN